MGNFNKVILLGNVTRDPEVRYTPKGSAVTEVGMAVNRQFTADNGEKREETTFVDVTLWGRTAEVAGEYLRKGRPVLFEGRLQLDSWEDKQSGQKRSKLRVVGETMQLLGGRQESGGGSGGGGGSSSGGGSSHRGSSSEGGGSSRSGFTGRDSAPVESDVPEPPDDDEIPF